MIKNLYKTNQLNQIYSECLDNLKYAYNILILEYFKKELSNNSAASSGKNSEKGTVIDVTEE